MSLLTNDPLTQLAFSIYENKGVYALLLGSGLSRSAEIPTGWEVTLDLIRRLASAQGVTGEADWAAWYRSHTKLEPNYSTILESLSSAPIERRSILHSYIEPTSEERDQGKKVPTAAHLAIADLVRDGYIKVIVTTNFDRLMENALRERGVEPTIVSSIDGLQGAEPVVHSQCYILKIHGDYKDARILNTDEELSAYSPEYDKLLDSIFDDYGLVVAGWSGEWDHALRASILRVPNRRYSMFWAARGKLGAGAEELIQHRRGKVVPITDADGFFTGLQQRIQTLAQNQSQNVMSVELAVATTKRFLSKPEFRIPLDDLFDTETKRLITIATADRFAAQGQWSPEEFRSRVAGYEAATETLAKIGGVIGRWGDGSELRMVADAIKSIYTKTNPQTGGLSVWLNIRSYPALLLFFAYGLGLVRSEKWGTLKAFLQIEMTNGRSSTRSRFVDMFWYWHWEGDDSQLWNNMEGFGRRHTPLSDHLNGVFSAWGPSFAGSTEDFELLFERFEILTSLADVSSTPETDLQMQLSQNNNQGYVRMPVGRSAWHTSTREQIFEELQSASVKAQLKDAGYVPSEAYIGLFITNYGRMIRQLGWRW